MDIENKLELIVENIIKNEDIDITQYEYIYFKFSSKIIHQWFYEHIPKIKIWDDAEDFDDQLIYCITEYNSIRIFRSYCSGCDNNNDGGKFIKCTSCHHNTCYRKPCLIINVNDKYFYENFQHLFVNIDLSDVRK